MSSLRRGSVRAACCAALLAAGVAVWALWPAAAPGGAAVTVGPPVRIMVVGAGNVVLSPTRGITATISSVSVGGHSCGVAEATPLAALANLRLAGGPAFAVRDYGHCNSSTRASGQLFVYSLDGETNHGQNGWEYKINNRSGTTGAGDPSGPFGNGRLIAAGSHVLWFWCQATAGGCQRNLVTSSARSVAHGGALRVRVLGYDNFGHGAPMAHARVTLGRASAVTGSSGVVTLRAPSRPTLVTLNASRPGSVPAFPEPVTVR
jgi:hypothetical protein